MSTTALQQRIDAHPILRELWNDVIADANRRVVEMAKRDPAKYKLCRVFEPCANWRYFPAGFDGRGRAVHFAWTTNRNAAGYFLTFREVVGAKETKRDQWAARKSRAAAKELARRRQNAFVDKHGGEQ